MAQCLCIYQKQRLLITSGILFQSMIPIDEIKSVPNDAVDVLGNARKYSILRLIIPIRKLVELVKILLGWNDL